MTEYKLLHDTIQTEHLLGLPFVQGTQDCYTMLRAMYKDNLGIELTNYARPIDWWIDDNFDLYRDNFVNEGFDIVDININNISELQLMDVILISIPDPRRVDRIIPNHCAIYIGNGNIIHHRYGTLSNITMYKGTLRNLTSMVLRHKDVRNLTTTTTSKVSILDKLLPHKRDLIMGTIKDVK